IWINEAELNGTEGVDDDKNGYIDDIYGYNFIYNNSDPIDDNGHGTHCSGIIAAEGDNSLDITGICWDTKIMALKFLGSLGEGSISDAVHAIYYAVVNGADVISNSWGASDESKLTARV
ncbi:MAG: S8 family serine peptidase, partial [Planctomycetota bacterium]